MRPVFPVITHQVPVQVRLTLNHAVIQRTRLLPEKGRVLVRVGQRVGIHDPIGRCVPRPNYMQIDLARGLGLPQAEIRQYLTVERDTQVFPGDVLVGPVGISRRVVRAPAPGRVVEVIGTHLILEVEDELTLIPAGYPGEIIEVIENQGVVIQSRGSLIQGSWANGKMAHGKLMVLCKSPDHTLTREQLGASIDGSLVCAGYCGDEDLLVKAEAQRVGGLILSSLHPSAILRASKVSYPVLVLEGFGRYPMTPGTVQLLLTHHGAAGFLNAQIWDPFLVERPELFVESPEEMDIQAVPGPGMLELGSTVRISTISALGKTAVVRKFLGVTRIPSGIRCEAVEVELENGDCCVVPLGNLELI